MYIYQVSHAFLLSLVKIFMLTYKDLYLLPQVINWRVCLKFPEEPKISDEARDLICRLLCDVDSRLGTRGAEEIKVRLLTNDM